MSDNYTSPQRYAVFEDAGNLLVSAAAGSGKTFTLSSRIVELIKSGKADIGEIAVVTFTRAAAQDMKRKIGDRIVKAALDLRPTDPVAAARLMRSSTLVPSADISTIDSFLYKILRKYFSSLGLSQDSRLIANSQLIERMKAETMRSVTDDLFESGDEDFLTLADTLATVRETEKIDEELFVLAGKLSSAGLTYSALDDYADTLMNTVTAEDSFLSSPFGRVYKDLLAEMLRHYGELFSSYSEEMQSYPEVEEKYGSDCALKAEWFKNARTLLDGGDFSALKEMFLSFPKEKLSPLSSKHACELSDEFKDVRTEATKKIGTLAEKMNKVTSGELILSRDKTVTVLRSASKVLAEYSARYEKKKRDLSMLEFSDLEALSVRLLIDGDGRPTEAAREIGSRYKYIFIDEYQDTNRTQDAIFRALASDAHRFMVGDIKQAIYRFRGADPSVFSEYRTKWQSLDPENDGGYPFDADSGRVLHMSNNFRSSEPVTNLTNAVSDYLLPFGGIPYGKSDGLICSRTGGDDTSFEDSEIVLIEKKKKKTGEKSEDGGLNPEIEYVADRIASMIGRQNGEKIYRAGDFAVLLRSNSKLTEFRDALQKRGIPAFIERDEPLSYSPAVMLVMCVLGFIDNPLRDVYTAGALRSPLFGFTLADLLALRERAGDKPIYLGLLACANDDTANGTLREKCASVVRFIEKEQTVSRGMSAKKYIEYLLDEISVFSIDGIRENGSERDAVNRLAAMAKDFEASVSGSVNRADLSAFIEYAEEALASGEKSGDKPSRSSEAVSVMTIHKSKGLEFPVCFVCDCGHSLHPTNEASKTVLFEKSLGIGMYVPDNSGLTMCDTLFRQAVSIKQQNEDTDEEMRILYVALSRACDKLIVTAKTQSADSLVKKTETAARLYDGYTVKNASSYIEWILAAVEKNKPARVSVKIYSDGEEFALTAGQTGTETAETVAAVPLTEEEFATRDGFCYPYGYLASLPSKLTVSKLSPTILDADGEDEIADPSRALDKPEAAPTTDEIKLKKPDFMTGEKWATASEKGSATHVFMQFADFTKLRERGSAAELERLVTQRFISSANASLVNMKQIERFAGSALMDKLSRSPFVKREFRFNVRMDADGFTTDEELKKKLSESGAKVTVQGVVDCVYRDPDTGELVLIDYKTDSMTAEEMREPRLAEEKLRARHSSQLTYYKKICAEMFGEPIPHAYVYSTVLGRTVEV